MKKEPVIEFKTVAEAKKYLDEWQHRLYLDDWIIGLFLVDGEEIPGDRGRTEIVFTHKSAMIRLARHDEHNRDRIVKHCHETSLVHELLHCKYDLDIFDETWEGRYAELYEHAYVEQMARSLIMAKYGLKPEWWNNVKEE